MAADTDIKQLEASALEDLDGASSDTEVEDWRIAYLGRKGRLTALLRSLSDLSIEERKVVGKQANKLKSICRI